VGPLANPDWLQFPFESVVTAPGTQTLPEIRVKVMVTPEIPVPALVATRPETIKALAGSIGVTLLDGLEAGLVAIALVAVTVKV